MTITREDAMTMLRLISFAENESCASIMALALAKRLTQHFRICGYEGLSILYESRVRHQAKELEPEDFVIGGIRD